MKENHSAQEIGQRGYAHWTGKPVTPGCHEIALVPQTLFDGWEAYCSCGQWRGFSNFYETPTREETLAALQAAFEKHKALPSGLSIQARNSP